jgi:hypothetical protein
MDSQSRFYESDPYSPLIVDDLLKGLSEWRNIQDIVRLTFKALSDVVRVQGQAIHDIERQLPLKVSRSEYTVALSQKASTSEICELHQALESRVPGLEFQLLQEEKVSRSDIQYLLSNKPSIEEVKTLLESKASLRDVESELLLIKSHFEDLYRDLNRKLNQIPNERELEFLHAQLKDKVARDEFREALEQKASKNMVTSSLSNKLDRIGFEEIIGQKTDLGDLQRILAALESKADYSLIEQLHAELQQKVDRTDFTHILLPEIAKKLDKYEIDLLLKDVRSSFEKAFLEHSSTTDAYLNSFKADLEQIRRNIGKKIEAKDVERLYTLVNKKADFESTVELLEKVKLDCRDMQNDLKREMKKSEDFDFRYRLESEVVKMKEQINQLASQTKDNSDEQVLYIKNINSATRSELQKDFNKLLEEVKNLQDSIQSTSKKIVEQTEFLTLKQLVQENQKGLDKVRENFHSTNQDFAETLKSVKDDVLQKQRTLESQVLERIESKVNLQDFPKLLESKLETTQVSRQAKATNDDLAGLKREIEKIHIELLRKCNSADLESHVQSTEFALEDVAKDMMLKCNIKDICALLDMKANIDDTNKALEEIHKDLDRRVQLSDFSSHINGYNSVIEALCAENCLGRWLWKSGELKTGSLVPWEIQSVNTAPDNFLWEREKVSIVTVAPGLYEIILGFYSRKKPTVQILVNGEPIMSAVNNSSYVIHHSSGKLKPVACHPNGNIAGLSMIDFIALPARARVSIGYTGEINSEGFIGLRKL